MEDINDKNKEQTKVLDNNVQSTEELDLSPFLNYLQTKQGHEISSRVLKIFEDIKKSALDHRSKHSITEKWIQAGIILAVIVSSSLLAHFGKFDSSMGVLYGTLVGYLFGKK